MSTLKSGYPLQGPGLLPITRESVVARPSNHCKRKSRFLKLLRATTLACVLYLILQATFYLSSGTPQHRRPHHPDSAYTSQTLARCRALSTPAGPPPDFLARTESDRFVHGTKPVLIKNATIWSGENDGNEVRRGDVLLDKGLIKWVGGGEDDHQESLAQIVEVYGAALDTLDAQGLWLTPGVIDMHSHVAVGPSPALRGAQDGNSLKAPAQPWLRSVDGINTHDDAFKLAVAGGVTTSLVLPGSANAIGGQAFVIKLRPTSERSTTAMLLEPPYELNGTEPNYDKPPRWRHMKHACGENPSNVYSQTRMDTVWQYREVYEKARQIKEAQDSFCEKAISGEHWHELGSFPEELQWEAAVDILRGHVKVQTHCYEAVDLDAFVRLSNEFKFPVAAFHHAHETYLVPEVLKKAYGEKPPASAMFAAFARYKREAYRHSEFAPRILNDNGLRVVMKSDHSAIVSRYLLHEAQQAHYYGLPANVSLKSVISTPAEVMGLDHRIGYVREGYDADIVLWDSHPLQLGATPIQVFIDGIPQLDGPYIVQKPAKFQDTPKMPNFDHEAEETLKYDGLPPLEPKVSVKNDVVIFANVSSVFGRSSGEIAELHSFRSESPESRIAVVRNGKLTCIGENEECASYRSNSSSLLINLQGGSIAPGLISYGTNLGLEEISAESSTSDGVAGDALAGNIPGLLGADALVRAVDGLQFSTRNALLAYRGGVTSAITPPVSYGFLSGISVQFSTGAVHKLEKNAILQDSVALHVSVHQGGEMSVSTQIAALRKLLLAKHSGDFADVYTAIQDGKMPLIVDTHSAEIIASIISLKKEVEKEHGNKLWITIVGATEAHLLASELASAKIGILLNPVRPFPYAWEMRRIMPGPPLSHESAIVHLLSHGVTVAVGVMGVNVDPGTSTWAARNARFDISWAAIEAGGKISKAQALALGSTNIEKLFGVDSSLNGSGDLVVTSGGDLLDFGSKVIGIISPSRGQVDLL